MKNEQKTKLQKIESLKKITKVSSAQLAAHNHYTLDENVRDMVLERNAAIEAVQVAVEQRKHAAELKKTEALQNALQKFTTCPNRLTVPDLKALVTATTNASDSPVKKKKDELQQQLYREPRYSRVKLIADDLRRTSDSAAAEALVALLTPALNPSAPDDPVPTPVWLTVAAAAAMALLLAVVLFVSIVVFAVKKNIR